ncbi:MAG: hypothetical protein RIQ96_2032 [Pseudomonadota bacterium]
MTAPEADWRSPDGAALRRPLGNSYWLWPGRLLAGEHPGYCGADALPGRLRALADIGIACFVDLSAPGDPVPGYEPLSARRVAHPITDFGVPSVEAMRAIQADIAQALRSGQRVYLHCRAGIGRTGTVAAVWLVEQGLAPDQALDLLRQKWQSVDKHAEEPHSPETEAQRAFVRAWRRPPRG